MPLVLKDRVRETSTTTGTGSITLGGALAGFQSFSVIGNANTTYYGIVNAAANEWEIGIGTYTASGTVLSRDTILESSNSGAAVNFSAGTKDVFVTYPAEKAASLDTFPEPPVIGNTTPNAATFTTLTATGQTDLGTGSAQFLRAVGGATTPTLSAQGSGTNVGLNLTTKGTGSLNVNNGGGQVFLASSVVASPTNYIAVYGNTASPEIRAEGASAVIDLQFLSKSTGGFRFFTQGTSFAEQLRVTNTTSAVNFVQVTGAATGNAAGPLISAQGSDANVPLAIQSKLAAAINFYTSGGFQQFAIAPTASAVNYIQVTGSSTGFGPRIQAVGSDTNIPLVVQPKGTGALQAQLNDGTATGGNARGANAVDWQTNRNAASQVASGAQSVIGGGSNNTASQQFSAVSGGTANNAGAYLSYIGGGFSNTTSRDFAAVTSGYANTAAGFYNYIGGGYNNSANSNSAVTTQSATMNGTTAVTLSGSNANIKVGQLITGTSISTLPPTYVAAISGTSLTLSQAASGSSTSTLSFFTPHGVVVGGGNNQATGAYSFIGGGGDAGTAGNRNVASGDWSFVGGGVKNVASGAGSVIAGGGTFSDGSISGNTASGAASAITGGRGHTASGVQSFIGGGFIHVASGTNSVVAGGYVNTANGEYSAVLGGVRGITRSISGFQATPAHVNPIADNFGVSQGGVLILGTQTTDATATVLRSNTSAASTTNQVILPNNAAYFFRGEVVSGVTGGGNTKGWTIEGVIKRGANAASTALVGTPTVTSMYADVGAATWTIAVTADTTNGGLAVTFTGQAGTTIRTVARINTVEMTF